MVSISAKSLKEDIDVVEGVEQAIANKIAMGKIEAEAEDVLQRVVSMRKALVSLDSAVDGGRDIPAISADLKSLAKNSVFSQAESSRLSTAAEELQKIAMEWQSVFERMEKSVSEIDDIIGSRFGEFVER